MKKFTTTLWMLVLVTLGLWILSKESFVTVLDSPMKSFTQISALLGAIGYFTSFIFSSRLPFFEKALPLDKSYKIHRIIGTLAGSGILLHVATLITNVLPSKSALTLYLLPGTNLAYTVGIFALYLVLIMLITTIYLELPYQLWKLIHKITSYSVVLASLHLLLIPSDISRYLPLRYWILGIAFAGVLAWIYREFIYPMRAFSHSYSVKDVTALDGITVITMVAESNPISLQPGQFAFFKVYAKKSAVKSESHPFTVLSSTKDTVMIAAKSLGDYTSTLQNVKHGDTLQIAGPHGSFGKEILESKKPEIWVAGGIGITPFFNLASYFSSQGIKKDFSLFYATSEQDKLFHPLLLNYSKVVGFTYSYHCSSVSERLSADTVISTLKVPPSEYNYFLCGPRGLLLSFMTALEAAGVPREQIFTEDFDFKSQEI